LYDLVRREYESSSQARKLAAVKALYRYLLSEGALGADPSAEVSGTRVKKRRPKVLSPAQVQRLLGQSWGDRTPERMRDRAMMEALYATGMRVSELVGLDVDDFNGARPALALSRGGPHARVVPVGARAAAAVADYIQDGRAKLLRRVNEHAMFLNHRGNRLTRQGFWLIIKGYARRANISTPITPHTLRHSFATHRLRAEGSVREVQELLGHASPATTQIYAELAREQRDDDAPAVAQS
jgi:integrase/recombinase XerD